MKRAFEKWQHWEFWPPSVFYLPVAVYYLWMALRYGGLRLPTQANPGIFSGGIVGESKWETLRALQECSPDFTATTWPIQSRNAPERLAELRTLCSNHGLSYPFILKPDVGQRGVGVKLIRSEEQAAAVLTQTDGLILLQRYAPGPSEVGVFYYRFPDESRGRIFAITEKVFPSHWR